MAVLIRIGDEYQIQPTCWYVRIIGVSFQGDGRALSSFCKFRELWNNEATKIVVKAAIPQIRLYHPNNCVELEGMLLPLDRTGVSAFTNAPPPKLKSTRRAEVITVVTNSMKDVKDESAGKRPEDDDGSVDAVKVPADDDTATTQNL